jgi:aerobic carbon-monoxide dehydrogenase medium subunit
MIPAQLAYTRPETLDEALAALSEPEAKALAGGQSLVSVLKLRLVRPSALVDIGRLDLRGVQVRQDELRIGALTTWAELTAAPELERPALRGIAECAEGIGDLQVKNRGTIGGSLAHADPASDMPAMLIALEARLTVRSAGSERVVTAEEFFLGPFLTALEPYELLTEVVVPVPQSGSGSAYEAIEHAASGFALAGAAVRALPDGTRTIGVTGIGARPFRLDGTLDEAEVFGDDYATETYKRHVAHVVLERAAARAQTRAEEDRTWKA